MYLGDDPKIWADIERKRQSKMRVKHYKKTMREGGEFDEQDENVSEYE